MFERLNPYRLSVDHASVLRDHSSTRPRIVLVEEDGGKAILKDFTVNRFLYRNLVGRFLVWREAKALRRLRHVKGVPSLYRVIDGLALVMEHIPGKDLGQIKKGTEITAEFFERLKHLVDRVHSAGIAHCDLKRKANVILGDDGLPYIVDWGASISREEFKFPLLNLVYRRFLEDDYLAVIKIKLYYIPEQVSLLERKRYNRKSSVEMLVRRLRDLLRNVLQKIA